MYIEFLNFEMSYFSRYGSGRRVEEKPSLGQGSYERAFSWPFYKSSKPLAASAVDECNFKNEINPEPENRRNRSQFIYNQSLQEFL